MHRNAIAFVGSLVAFALPTLSLAQTVPSSAFADGNTRFATELYARLRTQPGNLIFSPASISTALAMTYAGAHGDTASQIANVMHFASDAARLHTDFATQLHNWNTPRTTYEFAVANRLWGEQTAHFVPAFLDVTRTQYAAALQPMDFQHAPSAARNTINHWVAEQTHQHILDLLPAASITPDTRLVLTNAVYFHGRWVHAFSPSATRPAPFHQASGAATNVPTMHLTEEFTHAATDGVQVLEMPYQGGDIALDVILPDAQNGLADVEARLSAASLNRWLGGLQSGTVSVSLPRFTGNSSLGLATTLDAMGIHDAFDARHADFSAMAPVDPTRPLYIGTVIHKAFVELNEEGTVAAAATAVGMLGGAGAPPQITNFTADHPFLYVIRDLHSGALLFMGRVMNP